MKDFNEEAVLVTATAISFGMNDQFKDNFKKIVNNLMLSAYYTGKGDQGQIVLDALADITKQVDALEGK